MTTGTVRNEYEFRVFAMRRSGHHAIIVWLASHFPARSVHFINNVSPFRDPFLRHNDSRLTTSRADCFVDRDEEHIRDERELHKHCLMYNFEDRPFTPRFVRDLGWRCRKHVGCSGTRVNVLVLRDPYNLAASRLQLQRGVGGGRFGRTLALWANHAREFLGLTKHLQGPTLCVNYNRWFASRPYREELSRSLGLPFTDAGLNCVPCNGRGSSWNRSAYHDRAQAMDVLNRWQRFSDHPAYLDLFAAQYDVYALSEQIFGSMPGSEYLFAPDVERRPSRDPR